MKAPAQRPPPLAAAAVLLAGAAVLLAACAAEPGETPAPVATDVVDLPPSYRFEPETISVTAGTTVTWTNSDNFTHNVQFEEAEGLMMRPGESVSFTFEAPGEYEYVCSLHPRDMRGTVVVTPN